jgi:hypothetical protein
MSTYEFDLDVLNKLTGTYIDIVNLAGGGIGLAPGLKLILDKGTGSVRDYYDPGNSRRVMTIGGADALYLDAASLNILGRCLKNPKGLGGADGKRILFAEQYPGDDMVSRIHAAADDGGEGCTVIVPPGYHADCVQFVPKNAVTYIGAGRRSEDVSGGDTCLATKSGETYSIYSYYKSRYSIRNMTLRGAGWGLTPAYFRGATAVVLDNVQLAYMSKVDINYCAFLYLVNCELYKMGQECLDLRDQSHENMFLGCLFKKGSLNADDTYAAVRIRNSNTNSNTFLNCQAVNNWTTPKQKYGLQIEAGPAWNEIRGGRWEGKTDDWTDSGTGTVIDAMHS